MMFCAQCGQTLADDAQFCTRCGKLLVDGSPVLNYAGFWRRFFAFLLDTMFIAIISGMISMFFGESPSVIEYWHWQADQPMEHVAWHNAALPVSWFADGITWQGLKYITLDGLISWLWFTLSESSAWQATLGKRIMGMQVMTEDGQRMGFVRANVRFFSKILSGFILGLGYIMAAFTRKAQALHDIIASTVVVKKSPAP